MIKMDYLIIGIGWATFLALHSVLAAFQVKNWVAQNIPSLYRKYRLFYTIINSLLSGVLLYYMLVSESETLLAANATQRYIALVLASWGVIIMVVSFRHISGMAFLGFAEEEDQGLIRQGLHAKIRHPIYSGTILVVLGMMLYIPTDVIFTTGIVMLGYLPFGIYFEEKKLIAQFGEEYLEYKKEVPAIIPKIR